MITDDLFIYMLFQVILLLINIIGYFKIPLLSLFGILGTLALALPTVNAFNDYWMMALLLIMINMSLPVVGLTKALK